MIAIDQERFEQIVALHHGCHLENDDGEMCIMEAVAWVTHKEWSDHPPCVCPVLSTFMRLWNDGLPDDETRTRLLRQFIPALINTKDSTALEQRRAMMAADWLVRVHVPAWLRLAKMNKQADALESLPEITDFAHYCPDLMPILEAIRRDAAVAATAAGTAARDAAGTVAWEAAGIVAWDAAGDAAWAAARDAARAAAWDAAGAAARAAARDAISKTQDELQQSALVLVHRMIALKDDAKVAA